VIAVPAAAVGVTGVAAGGGLVVHGSWNLGKDIGDLHWNNQASQAGDTAPAAKQGDQGATAEPKMKWEGSPKHGATQRGRANPEPKDPQGSLDRSDRSQAQLASVLPHCLRDLEWCPAHRYSW
jgi:hypothetical protein